MLESGRGQNCNRGNCRSMRLRFEASCVAAYDGGYHNTKVEMQVAPAC